MLSSIGPRFRWTALPKETDPMFVHRLLRLACLTALSSGAMAVAAAGPPGLSASMSPVYQFDGDLDSGGSSGYTAVLMSFGGTLPLDARSSIGFRLRLDGEDWRFSDPVGFGGVAPWDRLYRAGISIPYSLRTEDGWRFALTPTLESAAETGARTSESLEYGATASIAKALTPDLTLGIGVGAFDKIEETSAFPFLVIDWRINERLRLTNPFAAGPAGPAGLELSYRFDSGWTAGLGAAYRSYRFRLDEDGPFPNGVGEHRFIPVFLQLGHALTDSLSLSLYAGLATATRLRVERSDGHQLFEEDQDPTAMLGLSLIGRF
jgi:hypothetical protein